jgi:phosphonoacetaldehyde hydrolase
LAVSASACPLRAVVFDWAGTTIDFGAWAPLGPFVQVFAGRGVEVSVAEARAPMGLHKKDHLRAMLEAPAVARRWAKVRGREWGEADLEGMYQELMPRQLAAVEQFSRLIPGVKECAAELRARGLRVGATTGYFRAAAESVAAAARRQGYEPDCNVCGDDVPAGRPAPWMLYRAMERLGVYPPAAVVKVGDTLADVAEGLNAGAWSVAVSGSSSEMGLTEEEYTALPAGERRARLAAVADRFRAGGAHAVVDSLAELPALLDGLNARLGRGERP